MSRAGFDGADAYLRKSFPGIKRSEMLVGIEFGGHQGLTFPRYLAAKGYEVEDGSPRKNDANNASQICKLPSARPFVTFNPLDETVGELRVLTTERQRLTVEATRLKNRLHSALDLAWPAFAGQFAGLQF